MEWAELILGYVKALAWPAVVSVAIVAFRKEISGKLADLKDATTPLGGASFFDRHARELEEQATTIAEQQETAIAEQQETDTPKSPPDEPERPAESSLDQSRRRLNEVINNRIKKEIAKEGKFEVFRRLSEAVAEVREPSEFEDARTLANTSPNGGFQLAYITLDQTALAAWKVTYNPLSRYYIYRSPGRPNLTKRIENLAFRGGLPDEFVPLVDELTKLFQQLKHSEPQPTISRSAALALIDTCETIAHSLASNALSQLRHPSRRTELITEWQRWDAKQGPAGATSSPDA